MLDVKEFYDKLLSNNVDFFCGVPDSLLKSFCAYVTAKSPIEKNIITANEGAAIALAAGYYIGTGRIPMIYMQNSGLGNAINPLMSLADTDVYSIPMILLIGWRGEPGVKDEPQHLKQGKVTLDLLDAMKIPYLVLDQNSDVEKNLHIAIDHCLEKQSPFAFVVRKDSFTDYKLENSINYDLQLTREEALNIVIDYIPQDSIVVSTTGMLSRELFELREKTKKPHFTDFLTVGSMGHTSQIALGISISNPTKQVYCFEGDGGAIMHLGSYAVIGSLNLNNLKIILFNNGAHDSVGGQPTIGFETEFLQIFKGFGFDCVFKAQDSVGLKDYLDKFIKLERNCLLEIKVKKGARKDLGRPTQTPIQTKIELMKYIKRNDYF